ncbi:hypothetical protein [Butyrivibrio sp. AC2005]|uniref:hypothetical protein n=1 Tax=Butyrivibrio sp. AC2005 TaxID=1280672 RepID=UPI00041E24F7|nr:hypothetical protein [Butyrivibrio sp. AC2005]
MRWINSEDFRAVVRMCRESGFSENRVYALCELLLPTYREKYLSAKAEGEIKPMTPEEMAASKRKCRDLFLYIFSKPVEESLEEQESLIDELIKLIWFREKIDMILDQMLDFRGVGNGYVYKMIIKQCYFDDEIRPNKEIYDGLGEGVKKSNFYDKRITGILLFGIKMWKYALRRQKEEMEEGIIPWKELPQNQEDLSKLRPID